MRLAGPEVARALEALAAIAPPARPRGLKEWQHGEALRGARSCYDHLAGVAGVALAEALVARGVLEPGEGAFAITARGEEELAAFGLDVPAIHGARRATARACLDWSERRPHVAGALGAALLDELLRRRWLRRRTDGRALTLTAAGGDGLAAAFGVELATIGTKSDYPGGSPSMPRMRRDAARDVLDPRARRHRAVRLLRRARRLLARRTCSGSRSLVAVLCVLWIVHASLQGRRATSATRGRARARAARVLRRRAGGRRSGSYRP